MRHWNPYLPRFERTSAASSVLEALGKETTELPVPLLVRASLLVVPEEELVPGDGRGLTAGPLPGLAAAGAGLFLSVAALPIMSAYLAKGTTSSVTVGEARDMKSPMVRVFVCLAKSSSSTILFRWRDRL